MDSSPSSPSPRKRDRFFNAIRLRPNTASSSTDDTDEVKPSLQRRGSVIDLFHRASIRSRRSVEKPDTMEEPVIRTTRSVSPFKRDTAFGLSDKYCAQVKRRKSLSEIVGTLTKKMSQKQRKWTQSTQDAESSSCNRIATIKSINVDGEDIMSTGNLGKVTFVEKDLENIIDNYKEMELRRLQEYSSDSTPSTHSWSSSTPTLAASREDRLESSSEDDARCCTPDSYLRVLVATFNPNTQHSCDTEGNKPGMLLEKCSSDDSQDFNSRDSVINSDMSTYPINLSDSNVRFLEQAPQISIREVYPSYDLEGLGEHFHRDSEVETRICQSFNVSSGTADPATDADVARKIRLIVARMTRNYHFVSSHEDCWPDFSVAKRSRADESGSQYFQQDQAEVQDSIIKGIKIMQQALPYRDPKEVPSLEYMRFEASLKRKRLTVPGNDSAKKTDPSRCDELDIHDNGLVDTNTTLGSTTGEPTQQQVSYTELKNYESVTQTLPLHDGEEETQFHGGQPLKSIHATVVVKFPGIIYPHDYEEEFTSVKEALLTLSKYKLANISNFCAFDHNNRVIYIHALDDTVPSPAELERKGLQLIWLPSQQIVPLGLSRRTFGDLMLGSGSDSSSTVKAGALEVDHGVYVPGVDLATALLSTDSKEVTGTENQSGIENQDTWSEDGLDFDFDANYVLNVDPVMARSFLGSQFSDDSDSDIRSGDEQEVPTKLHTDLDHTSKDEICFSPVTLGRLVSSQDKPNSIREPDLFADEAFLSPFPSYNDPLLHGDIGSEGHDGHVVQNEAQDFKPPVWEADYAFGTKMTSGKDLRAQVMFPLHTGICNKLHQTMPRKHNIDEGSSARKSKRRSQSDGKADTATFPSLRLRASSRYANKNSHKRRDRQLPVLSSAANVPRRRHRIPDFTRESDYPQLSLQEGSSSQEPAYSFASGFKFTTYADQFEKLDNEELSGDQEDVHRLSDRTSTAGSASGTIPLSPKLSVRKNLYECAKKSLKMIDPQKMMDMQRHFESPAFLHPSEENRYPALGQHAPDNMKGKHIDHLFSSNEKSSPRFGALVDIFQAHRVMPLGFQRGLYRENSPASSLSVNESVTRSPSSSSILHVE